MKSKPTKKASKRLLKTKPAQVDVIERLNRTELARSKYRGLAKCASDQCGMHPCRDVCCYATRRRWANQVNAAYRLLKNCEGPYYEVHIARSVWSQAKGELHKASLAAAKQLNRRAFDALHYPGMIAVGMFKAAFESEEGNGSWRVEIHQIVAGVDRDEIEKVFSTRNHKGRNHFWIGKVPNLKDAIKRVLRQDLIVWHHPSDPRAPGQAKNSVRREYYHWALRFTNGARTMRYGCDRHFNKLKKRGRTIRPKARKPRCKPWWLEAYQFGSDT